MKTVFKIFRKLVKWYLVFNTLCWAFIGSGLYAKRCFSDKYKDKSSVEIQSDLLNESLEGYKKCLKQLKNV